MNVSDVDVKVNYKKYMRVRGFVQLAAWWPQSHSINYVPTEQFGNTLWKLDLI